MLTRPQKSTQQKLVTQKGFTLVEAMIGTVIFTLAMIGLLGTTILSYKYALMARYKERAENALMTMADQFQNSPVVDVSSPSKDLKTFFQDTSGANVGTGMAWDSQKQCFVYPGGGFSETNPQYLLVPLNSVTETSDLVSAKVTRKVESFGDPYGTIGTTSTMIVAHFTATYDFLGTQTLTIRVLRTISPTDKTQ